MTSTVEVVSFTNFAGNILGLSYPSVVARLRLSRAGNMQSGGERFSAALERACPISSVTGDAEASGKTAILDTLVRSVAALLEVAGHPVPPGDGRTKLDQESESQLFALALPVYSHAAVRRVLGFVTAELNPFLQDNTRTGFEANFQQRFDGLIAQLTRSAPLGSNARNMIQAGYDLDLPFLALPGQVLHFGWGSAAKRFVSSSSEETGTIGMNLSRRKDHTSSILRAAGLPVADQRVVRSLEAAIESAEDIGYPVVLKVLDSDQGRGVFPGLAHQTALSKAWAEASALSRHIAVERFIVGQDYRINVVDGQVVGAIVRIPASVVGDGKSSVRSLIDEVNKDPRRSMSSFATMKPIVVDEEAEELLDEAGLSLDDVPPVGLRVMLRRTANVSTGGHSAMVLDQVHPENADLAVLAAQQLGLDISGVDLIMPDISKPWRAEDSVVSEINGRPQIGLNYKRIFKDILAVRVAGDGRVPVALALGPPDQSGFVEDVQRLAGAIEGLAVRGVGRLSVGTMRLAPASNMVVRDTRALLMTQTADRLLLHVTPREIVRHGSPVDRYAAIAVRPGTEVDDSLRQAIVHLMPYLSGALVTVETSPVSERLVAGLGSKAISSFQTLSDMADHLAAALTAP